MSEIIEEIDPVPLTSTGGEVLKFPFLLTNRWHYISIPGQLKLSLNVFPVIITLEAIMF